jgi:hypothetical protein
MKVTLYYKGLATFLTLFVLLIVSPTYVRADEVVDIKPCYECLNCDIDEVTLEPVPPEGEIAEWVQCSDLPSINVCSNGLTVVGVIDFEVVEPTEAIFLGATSLRFSVEDLDHNGIENDVVFFFKTKELQIGEAADNGDGSSQACLQITNSDGTIDIVGCDAVVLFSKGRCDKGPKKLKKAQGKKS